MHAHDMMYEPATEGCGTAEALDARLRTPEERRELAHEALTRNGYTPAGPLTSGVMVYRPDLTIPPVTHSAFARITLASGGVVAVNPRRVVHVRTEATHEGGELTMILLTSGDVYPCMGTLDEVVSQLDEVAA